MAERCRPHAVYVLQLPNGRGVYVGSTAKPIRERLAEHRERFGARTRLVGAVTWCTDRAEAEKVERKLAERLRAQGERVRQG